MLAFDETKEMFWIILTFNQMRSFQKDYSKSNLELFFDTIFCNKIDIECKYITDQIQLFDLISQRIISKQDKYLFIESNINIFISTEDFNEFMQKFVKSIKTKDNIKFKIIFELNEKRYSQQNVIKTIFI
jgi:hypothetical protein